jgi:predicted hydrocarbon binding protein
MWSTMSNVVVVTGIIFNLLEEAVTRHFGAEAWAEMLERVGSGGYLPFDRYEDDEFTALLMVLPLAPETDMDDRLRWFGKASVALLAQRYPIIFEAHRSTETFLLTLGEILAGGAAPGGDGGMFDFEVAEGSGPQLVLGYRSARRMCKMTEGFVTGAAEWFGERVLIEQPRCMHHGADRCSIVCTFERAA